jgi:hypothetical protein
MGDGQNALPVSPPIFVPGSLTSPRAERTPWFTAASGLSIACAVTWLVLAATQRDGGFHAWTWRPFLPAVAWAAAVLSLAAAIFAVPRGTNRARAAILGVALLAIVGLLVTATVQHQRRSDVVPRLAAYGRGLAVPPGFESTGPPTRIAVDDRYGGMSFVEPTFALTWKTTPATNSCTLLERQLTVATGWQGGATPGSGCEFVRTSGWFRVEVSSGVGAPKPSSSAVVKVSPNDGA